MSNNSSTSQRLKGVYLRGKKFWYRYSYEGHQYRIPLDTDDEAQAITKAFRIQANPLLAGADPLSHEIQSYVKQKQEEGIYTRNSADSREAVLNSWANDRKLKEVRQIDSDEIKTWLTSLRRGKDRLQQSSIESYGMIIRGFCAWLVAQHKLRENPADFIKSKTLTSAKRRRFCTREQVDELIEECPNLDLKFILYAGFHAGLREDEIVQARPEWFDLRLNIVHIVESPAWKPKDKDKRTIPLTRAFRDFLANEMTIKGELPGPLGRSPAQPQLSDKISEAPKVPGEKGACSTAIQERSGWLASSGLTKRRAADKRRFETPCMTFETKMARLDKSGGVDGAELNRGFNPAPSRPFRFRPMESGFPYIQNGESISVTNGITNGRMQFRSTSRGQNQRTSDSRRRLPFDDSNEPALPPKVNDS